MTSIITNPYAYQIFPVATASSMQATLDIGTTANSFYGNTFSSIVGGTPPYKFSVFSGSVPTGMTLLGSSGFIFSGTSYLTSGGNTNYQLTGDFTIEFWALTTVTVGGTPAGLVNLTDTSSSGNAGASIYFTSSGAIKYFIAGNATETSSASNIISANTWYHVALVRSGSGTYSNKLYVNGVNVANSAITPTWATTPHVGIGRIYNDNTSGTLTGYISNVRIVRGQALYTGNFTPPSTTPITLTKTSVGSSGSNIASSLIGTVVMLTAQSSNTTTTADNSGLGATFTNTGSVRSYNGVVYGTPTAQQSNTSYTVGVIDSLGVASATQSPSNYFVINPAFTATACTASQSYITGTAITTYNPLTASGGTTPYVYSFTGTIPTGLSYSTSTGALSGTPTVGTAGSFNATFSVTDTLGYKAATTSTVAFTSVDRVPLAPTIGAVAIDLSADPNGGAANVAYTAPDNTNRPTITSYTAITLAGGSDTGARTTVSRAGSGSISVTGLSGSTSYTFEVFATNSAGAGANSSPSSAYTIATPSAPTIGTVVLDPGGDGTSVRVNYTAPSNTGKAPITSYTAIAYISGSPAGITGTASQSGSGYVTVTGLTRSTTYTFKVYATNKGGDSSLSSASSGYTVPTYSVGSSLYNTPGNHNWDQGTDCPSDVTSVSIVGIGGGGGASLGGGGGGSLSYINNISVSAGQRISITVGAGGSYSSTSSAAQNGGTTTVIRVGSPNVYLINAGGGGGGSSTAITHNYAGNGGGGGAAGYAGNGGAGSSSTGGARLISGGVGGVATNPSNVTGQVRFSGGSGGTGQYYNGSTPSSGINSFAAAGAPASSSGGGAGGAAATGGGGVNVYGQSSVDSTGSPTTPGGTTAAGGGMGTPTTNGGSGGTDGQNGSIEPSGGSYGGGGGGSSGQSGAVLIVWPGATRLFPSTGIS